MVAVILGIALLLSHQPAMAKTSTSLQLEQLKGELAGLQKQAARVAASIQEREKMLSALEEKLTLLTEQAREKQKIKHLRERQLASIIEGLLRLSRIPPESVVAMPGDYTQTLRTAGALGVVSSAIRKEAAAISTDLEELTQTQAQIARHRDALVKEKKNLQLQQASLKETLKARGTLQQNLFNDWQKQSRKIAEQSSQSGSVKELVASLEKGRVDKIAPEKTAKPALRSFLKSKGKIKLPAAGKIVQFFGESADIQAAKGMVLKTRNGAQVTAPYDAEVVYSGNFRDYGRMVILRHSDGYHTLLAGLERIECTPGQFLLEGEPIGAMGNAESQEAELYMELRERGRPVDPAPWMRGASKLARQ